MGYGNGTVAYGIPASGTFTYRKPMPNDQKAKLLAMHRAGRANAGIYVAVVLAVYVVLLTILLCRYTRRQRPSEPPSTNETGAASGFLSFTANKMGCGRRGIFYYLWPKSCTCSCCCPGSRTDEAAHEITDYPLSTIQRKTESSQDKPTCV